MAPELLPATVQRGGQWYTETECFSTIFEDKIKQHGITTAALTFSNIKSYLQCHPEVKRILVTSDNAGAYKSGTFIQSLL